MNKGHQQRRSLLPSGERGVTRPWRHLHNQGGEARLQPQTMFCRACVLARFPGYACRKHGLAPLPLVVGFRSRPAHIQGDSPMRALRATNPHRSSSYSWRKLGCVEVALIWRGFHTSRVWTRLRLESRFTSLLSHPNFSLLNATVHDSHWRLWMFLPGFLATLAASPGWLHYLW